jgi:hypothetical protein
METSLEKTTQEPQERKTYEAPALVDYGNAADLTKVPTVK